MSFIKNTLTAIKENKGTIIRKTSIVIGAATGMLLTSTLVDRLGDRRPSDDDFLLSSNSDEAILLIEPEIIAE